MQAALFIILTPVYEAEFLVFSYGFRPRRGQHDALDALAYGIKGRNVRWILDADIRSFFDTIDHERMVRFLQHRIGDKRVFRLIQTWLKAGVLDGTEHVSTTSVDATATDRRPPPVDGVAGRRHTDLTS